MPLQYLSSILNRFTTLILIQDTSTKVNDDKEMESIDKVVLHLKQTLSGYKFQHLLQMRFIHRFHIVANIHDTQAQQVKTMFKR